MQLVWFRRDLRTYDNRALAAAIDSGEPVVAVYIATPKQWQAHHLSSIQADLIYRRLLELKRELAEINIPLIVHQTEDFSQAVQWLCQFASNQKVEQIHYNYEYELNEQIRDRQLITLCHRIGIEVSGHHDKAIFAPGSIRNKEGKMYRVFTPFKQNWLAQFSQYAIHSVARDKVKHSAAQYLSQPYQDVSNQVIDFDYPRRSSDHYFVTRSEVEKQLDKFVEKKLEVYDSQRDFPASEQTSRLSPYLALGMVSARECIERMSPYLITTEASAWLNELIWRDFYIHLVADNSALSKGKPFHQWGEEVRWDDDEVLFECWKVGKTGYPIVDAGMRQLNQTGWMHNRLRMIVASFLCKDLLINWRWGEDYFMSQLVDGDYAANNGGWQWCSSTGCDGQPYFRIFNPITQGEKFDPKGEFVKRWIPELSSVPDKYIHKPWQWAYFQTLEYPSPIVDHKQQRKIALERYRQAKDQ